MATILITGNSELFTQDVLEKIAEHYRVVITGQSQWFKKQKNVLFFNTKPTEEKFSQLFDVYSFDAVWYVTGYADGGEGTFGEMQLLEQTMLECQRSNVEKVIVLSTIDSQNYLERYEYLGDGKKEYPFGRAFGAAQTEEIINYYAERFGQKTITLWLPYLAGDYNDKNFLGTVFRNMYEKKKVMFPYHKEDRVDFLSYNDLLELLYQIVNETDDESGSYYVTSGYQYQYGDLEQILRISVPDIQVLYENYPNTANWPKYPTELRKKYGFVPMDNVVEDMGRYYRTFVNEIYPANKGFSGKILRYLGKAGAEIFKYVELLLLFFLTEFISTFTSNSVYFKFVDVRLLFIVIIGTMYGMRLGIFAAILECIVLVAKYSEIGMNGTILFYNIENWIPFVIYLMIGSITGYVKNKKTEELEFAEKEYSLLRNKYIFLNEVYHGAVQNKGEYKKQILGFKDSFGKIFDAVQKLDNELPDSIFLEGLRVMEDILENRTIAIYTLDSWERYGRLSICSNSQLRKLTKSIKIDDYRDMYEEAKKGNVWKNTDMTDGLPMYACGVFRNNKMVLLITIQSVNIEQYSMHYMNIFRILCGLVQTSFLRALEYEELRSDQIYYAGTNIVYPERMAQMLELQENMRIAGVADYVLVKLLSRDKKQISESLSGMIRATDIIGADENGDLFLLLVQMDLRNFGIVARRLEQKNIPYELVEKVG